LPTAGEGSAAVRPLRRRFRLFNEREGFVEDLIKVLEKLAA
jgi:hypothetical protein